MAKYQATFSCTVAIDFEEELVDNPNNLIDVAFDKFMATEVSKLIWIDNAFLGIDQVEVEK